MKIPKSHFKKNPESVRYEGFGGIISFVNPPYLAFVSRDYMKQIGYSDTAAWKVTDAFPGKLSAPTEVHYSVTEKCSGGCSHCYMDSKPDIADELSKEDAFKVFDKLAELGVFHVAMGGGDALEREDLFELAEYAASKGLVPNLTVAGSSVTEANAARFRIFGQVNVSVDGTGPLFNAYRHGETFAEADRALRLLQRNGVSTGINCVIGRRTYAGLFKLFAYAASAGIRDIEFLRYKPSGRAAQNYESEKLTAAQNRRVTGKLRFLATVFRIRARIDCSFIPMLCSTGISLKKLRKNATFGCEAGNVLWGVRSNGAVAGCSFMPPEQGSDLSRKGLSGGEFKGMIDWVDNAPQPCVDCRYLNVCRGGCRAVALHCTGDYYQPDPDCPLVQKYLRKKKISGVSE